MTQNAINKNNVGIVTKWASAKSGGPFKATSSRLGHGVRPTASHKSTTLIAQPTKQPTSAFSNVALVSSNGNSSQLSVVNEEPDFGLGLNEIGGLADDDEIHGIERDAAIASPLKGKTSVACLIYSYYRSTPNCNIITSRALSKPKRRRNSLQQPRARPPSSENRFYPSQKAPPRITASGQSLLRPIFVGLQNTLILGASNLRKQSVPCKRFGRRCMARKFYSRSLPTALFMEGYVFCFQWTHNCRCSCCFQADQRVRDSWRTAFASAAMLSVNDFFDANKKVYSTNESRQEAANDMLTDLKFLYSTIESDNPKVRVMRRIFCPYILHLK